MVIVALVLSLGMVVLPAGEVRAQGADVFIDPTLKDVVPLETFTVNVDIIPGEPTAGAQFDMSFDQSLLTCTGVTEGDLYDQGPGTTYWLPPAIDNGAGTITGAACAIIGTAVPVSAPGTFATISFTAKDVPGTLVLDLSNVVVGDASASSLPVTVTDGSVTVGITITGTTGEVSCSLLPNTTVEAYKDPDPNPKASTVSDPTSGDYTLSLPETGDYDIVASKDGYREESQLITVDETTETLDFRGNYGLIPNDPATGYVLACIGRWQYPVEPCELSTGKVLAVIGAWQYPISP